MKMQQFSYTSLPSYPGGMPFVTILLKNRIRGCSVSALVDSGSALNIMPFDVGLTLGFSWEKQTFPLDIAGTLKGTLSFAVLVKAEIVPFPPVDLAFAWADKPSNEIPVLLGQVNFFKNLTYIFMGITRLLVLLLDPIKGQIKIT